MNNYYSLQRYAFARCPIKLIAVLIYSRILQSTILFSKSNSPDYALVFCNPDSVAHFNS